MSLRLSVIKILGTSNKENKKTLLLKYRCQLMTISIEIDPNKLCIIPSHTRHTRTSLIDDVIADYEISRDGPFLPWCITTSWS